MVRRWKIKYGISDELLADLNGLLWVGLVMLDFHWDSADIDPETKKPLLYGPEHPFKVTLDDGTVIKGKIDDMAVVGGVMQVRDFKSAKNKMVQADVPHNIQAAIYQLYVWREFKLPARVEFVFLRHSPSKRYPNLHLQVVEPASPTKLAGLTEYLQWMYQRMNNITLEEATRFPHEDTGFCKNVCTHYAPHPYWTVVNEEDMSKVISSHLSEEVARAKCGKKEMIIRHEYKGCPVRWKG